MAYQLISKSSRPTQLQASMMTHMLERVAMGLSIMQEDSTTITMHAQRLLLGERNITLDRLHQLDALHIPSNVDQVSTYAKALGTSLTG